MNNILKIYVCHHKQGFFIKNKIYEPIHGGREISETKLDMQGDNTGENISHKNRTFAELTVLYWIWKNKKYLDSHYIGLCHYRRFFTLYKEYNNSSDSVFEYFNKKLRKIISIQPYFMRGIISLLKKLKILKNSFFGLPINITLDDFKIAIKREQKFLDSINNYDVIIPRKTYLGFNTIENQYKIYHISQDLNILKNILLEKYPKLKMILADFWKSHFLSFCNMFIMKREIFIEYCEWLFDIILEAENRILVSQYESEKKVFGYLAERLLNLFLYLNRDKLKVKEIPFYFILNP